MPEWCRFNSVNLTDRTVKQHTHPVHILAHRLTIQLLQFAQQILLCASYPICAHYMVPFNTHRRLAACQTILEAPPIGQLKGSPMLCSKAFENAIAVLFAGRRSLSWPSSGVSFEQGSQICGPHWVALIGPSLNCLIVCLI